MNQPVPHPYHLPPRYRSMRSLCVFRHRARRFTDHFKHSDERVLQQLIPIKLLTTDTLSKSRNLPRSDQDVEQIRFIASHKPLVTDLEYPDGECSYHFARRIGAPPGPLDVRIAAQVRPPSSQVK